jgi:hypothetical protein
MASITKQEILDALRRLGELALAYGEQIELILMGGALMVILFGERQSTRDLDVLIISPLEATKLRQLAQKVGTENGWPADWLNDAAKGYLVGLSTGEIVFSAPGIIVKRPSFAQLLAMKLSAWRDELDIVDARRLLKELSDNKEEVWKMISPYIIPGSELKAQYAFEDLWESVYGDN